MRLRLKRNDQIGLFFFVAFILSSSLIWFFEERFDKDIWRIERATRYKLVDDIIKNQLLIGKTKDEVVGLLGEPTSKVNLEQESFIYRLGRPPSFFEPKEELLLIIFINQKVIEVTQLQE